MSDRKFDYKRDTKNGADLKGWSQEEILQAGWYALQSRSEQNEKQKKIMALAKNDPRFKGVIESARQQIKKTA